MKMSASRSHPKFRPIWAQDFWEMAKKGGVYFQFCYKCRKPGDGK